MKKKAIIVDLDGTLCNVDHRVHYVQQEKKNWKLFNQEMINDQLNNWCYELIESMRNEKCDILFVTGRGEEYRKETEKWLFDHDVKYDHLYMRELKDSRSDNIIKNEIYENKIASQFQILFVVDDRLSVVKMWRSIGLVCLQCDWGDF